MSDILTIAIIGTGHRGCGAYGSIIRKSFGDKLKVTAMCDIDPVLLERRRNEYHVAAENAFTDADAFFAEKRADILFVTTQDHDHAWMTIKGLELGYDILVEKPIADKREDCLAMLAAQKKSGKKVFVCHVLRYAPAFLKASELLDTGRIGRLVCIEATEQVWYAHQAHSYVRGNWRRDDVTAPMILAKSCHDLDLLQHYAKARCKTIASVGDLVYFKPENAPEGAAERCLDCHCVDTCPYSAKRIYLTRDSKGELPWMTAILCDGLEINEENALLRLKTSQYGRCVYHCDNDVVDHEETMMTFENGVKAVLTMTGFTNYPGRKMTFHGTLGEIQLDEHADTIRLLVYGEPAETWKISELSTMTGAEHGGGDYGLVSSLYDMMTGKTDGATTLEASIESHLMGIAAEESRREGGVLKNVH